MTLEEDVAKLERGLRVSDELGPDWSRAPNGDKYLTLTHDGFHNEFDPTFTLCEEQEAIESWLRHAMAYRGEAIGPNLYWRLRPSVERPQKKMYGCRPSDGFVRVYSRLLIAPD